MEVYREKNKSRYLCIFRNIRNNKSKAWNKRTANWALLVEFLGIGSTSAQKWCEWLGIDPDAHSV
jgi:ribosomal protein S13